MSSELTIDIQLTELGFSSWDFQVLKQKETNQTSDLEYASSSSSSSSLSSSSAAISTPASQSNVEIPMDEGTDVDHFPPAVSDSFPSDNGSWVDASFIHVDSTETGTGERVSEKESGRVSEKRRKCSWDDTNDDGHFKEGKKKKGQKDQTKRDQVQRKLMSHDDSGEEEEEEVNEEEEEEEDEGEDDDGDDYEGNDDHSMEDEEHGGELSSDPSGSRCHVCNLTFSSAFLLREHLHIHNGVRLYRCAECGKQFCHLVNYRKHLRSHSKVFHIQCIICTTQFATQEDLQHHLDTNHFEDKFYQCDLCKRIFTSMAECKKHVQTHKRRTKRFPCPKCEHSFRHRSSMLYHLKRHNKGVFVCTDCGLAFSTKAVLLRHSFHHLGLLPYTCIRCKRHFRLSSLYLKHECKPEQLQCVACLVIFKSQEDFLKHKKDTGCWGDQTALSTKANDIRCMECGQIFDSSEELKKHAGTHQRIMRCSECGMGFRSSIMLMSHMGGHAAQRPCLCKECGLGFCHQQAYDSHIKTCGLVNPAEIGTKKQKPHSRKKEAAATPKSKDIQPVRELVHMQPAAVAHAQTSPAEGLSALTQNKEPLSHVPLVMLLPVPSTSTSTSECIQNPQKSDVLKTCLSAPQVIQVPLPPTNCSRGRESDETKPVKDVAGPVTGSKIMIPLTSVTNDKTGWTLLEGPCTSDSVTKIYALKKDNEQGAKFKLKQIIYVPHLNAKNQQKNKVLSNEAILKVLNMMKSNVCGDKRMETVTSLTSVKIDNAEEEKQVGSRMENSNASTEKNSDAQLTVQSYSADLQSSVVTDSSPVNRQPDEVQIPKSKLNLDELSPKNNEQKTDKQPEEENVGLESAVIGLGDESDIVQCETCGEMIVEKDMVQHNTMH